jgi:hemerythrin
VKASTRPGSAIIRSFRTNSVYKKEKKMAYINWSEDFSVHVREIDAQHKTLVEKINQLHQSLLDNKGREAQQIIIEGMVDYANVHFETEEKYMRRLNYPGFQKHKIEHEKFAEKAFELHKRFNLSGFVLTLEILSFLKNWLQEHILVIDKEYSKFFNENGVH